MKKIIYNNEEFCYDIDYDKNTNFYSTTETETERCGLFWLKTKQVPKFLFYIAPNIESSYYSKNKIREFIKSGYEYYQRQLEIERGEII